MMSRLSSITVPSSSSTGNSPLGRQLEHSGRFRLERDLHQINSAPLTWSARRARMAWGHRRNEYSVPNSSSLVLDTAWQCDRALHEHVPVV